ncbi:4Fe-4S dicluster domain-containing protein [Azospirillum halopraeferens]|uniref:4Fe-4S dicluster domain-containing protein n=1 Tax=Azospirillum halopraeferens TaxID=34010 RepID=UPI0012EBF406|nr:4Fe-4S dicluster domain-containing protein [Azospirillum halopraeferens]
MTRSPRPAPWRSPEERAGHPDRPPPVLPETSRRDVLRIMGATLALAGTAGCDGSPPERAIPYAVAPEDAVPGEPRYYATAVTLDGYAQPVVAETHEGRPTRLDGNPRHPLVEGRIDAFAQAAVLDLYDPARSAAVWHAGAPVNGDAFDTALAALRADWAATAGEGVRLLTGPLTSPTLLRRVAAFLEAYPRARWHAHAPVGPYGRQRAVALAAGRPLDRRLRPERAAVVVSIGDDPLGPGPEQVAYARGWSRRRQGVRDGDAGALRLLVAEATPTLTGAVADRRCVADAGRLALLVGALAHRLGSAAAPAVPPELSAAETAWVAEAASALEGAGGRSLLLAGPALPDDAQALALVLNAELGNLGATLDLVEPIAPPPPDGADSLAALVADLEAGRVTALIALDVNPVYASPGDLDVAGALSRAAVTIHAGLYRDETGERCTWHVPLAHALESWGDARAVDGTVTIQQPMLRPLFGGRPAAALLAALTDGGEAGDEEAVRATWRAAFGDGFEARWAEALRLGHVPGSAPPSVVPERLAAPPPSAEPVPPGDGYDLLFLPDPTVWDGRFAANAWLQELPKPLTKLSWDAAVLVAPALAAGLGVETGGLLTVAVGGTRLTAPAWVMPGQAPRTLTVMLGHGRGAPAGVGAGVGYDAYTLRRAGSPWLVRGAAVERAGGTAGVVTTQTHGRMEGRDIIRIVAPGGGGGPETMGREQPSLYPDWPYEGHAWGMVIDLDACIGCNACVIACQAENSVPVVGRNEVARRREMHWLRIDRYYDGDAANPRTLFQPVPCMHCEKAPCEMGCPVNATVHGPEGLNQMVYNRCIGTRTCAAYCPYEVRRFNYFDYAALEPEGAIPVRNPDVTVRSRGVMEKCTYCVQRINAARRDARREGREIRDGDVRTACQGACPTDAIVFGDINDPGSAVARARRSPRHYALLGELGTRPRTTYLARVADEPDGEGA